MTRAIRYIINKIYTLCNQIRGMKIGKGSLLHCKSDITNRKNISIGKHAIIYKHISLYVGKHGSFSMLNHSHVAPYGYFLIENNSISIGNDAAIGPFCSFFCSSNSHSPEKPLFRENYEHGDIQIGNNVFIGAQTVVLPNTQIGDDVIIAANSVVKGKLESGYIYGGTPCKLIKKLSQDD